MQNSHKGNKTLKWDRIQWVWTVEQSTQFVYIKLILLSWNHQSYNQQVYWLDYNSIWDIHLYILPLSFRIKTNESLDDQVFQEVGNFLQLCWVSNFVCILWFQWFVYTKRLHPLLLLMFQVHWLFFTGIDWYWIMLHWLLGINQDLITFG